MLRTVWPKPSMRGQSPEVALAGADGQKLGALAIGTTNSTGVQVQSVEMGLGFGLEFEGYEGMNLTESGVWFTGR